MRKETEIWLKQAEENFKTMEAMWRAHRYSFTCFMAHQTLEAILKAVIVESGKRHPKIHDLGKLYMDSGLPIEEGIRLTLEKITPHYWQVRYPDIVRKKYNQAIAKETYNQTKSIYLWIKEKLSKN
jgi:HEPN domain-containing protein